MSETPRGHRLHMGIAEQGKVHALAGDHGQALRCYREAIQLAVGAGAPEVFFRHYMECTLESLERMGSFSEVLDYTERAITHYAQFVPTSDEQRAIIRVDLVHVYQRRGVVSLKMGRVDDARGALEKAQSLAREAPRVDVPLVETLLGWIVRGFHVEPQRILAEQETRRYFSVRPDTVDKSAAIDSSALNRGSGSNPGFASRGEVPGHG